MHDNGFFKISREFTENYTRTNYRVVGKFKHSAIKPCYWLEQKLLTGRNNRNCYKGYFGIKSELCIQNSPAFPFCNHSCVFCWRNIEQGNLGSKFVTEPDDPDFLVQEMIRHQKNIIEFHFPLKKALVNYNIASEILKDCWISEGNGLKNKQTLKNFHTIESFQRKLKIAKNPISKAVLLLKNMGVLKTDDLQHYYVSGEASKFLTENNGDIFKTMDKYVTNDEDIKKSHKLAMEPGHAAISLDGEPTLYPFIGDYVSCFRKRKMTTFIVTNGTNPETLQTLNDVGALPTQLYVTIPAPNEQTYKKVCRPKDRNTWNKILKTLLILPDLKTRKCIRITCVKNLNLSDKMVPDYVELIENAKPDFLDLKGFTHEGSSMNISKRLGTKEGGDFFFPNFEYLLKFAQKLENEGNFKIIETHEKSRDILLRVGWPEDKSIKITKEQI